MSRAPSGLPKVPPGCDLIRVDDRIETMRWFSLAFLPRVDPDDPPAYLAALTQVPGWTQIVRRQWALAQADTKKGRMTLRELAELGGQSCSTNPDTLPLPPDRASFVLDVFAAYGTQSYGLTPTERLIGETQVATLVLMFLTRTVAEGQTPVSEVESGLRGETDPLAAFEYLADVLMDIVPALMNRRPPWATDRSWDACTKICEWVDADWRASTKEGS